MRERWMLRLRLGAGLACAAAAFAIAACQSGSSSAPDNGATPTAAATATATATTHTPPTPPSDKEDAGTTGTINPDGTGVPDAAVDCKTQTMPGDLGAIDVTTLTAEKTVPMCIYKGNVLLIVNTASMCGYTPEYGPLQTIYTKYAAQGFYVLGFPSQTFAQEYADAQDVSSFCTQMYGITFPMFQIANVNPPDQQPVYQWLAGQQDAGAPIEWNFAKFLINRKGELVQRFPYNLYPDDPMVTSAIEAELAK